LYWNQAQRESFCDWFLLPSLTLQAMRPALEERVAKRRIVIFSALTAITLFSKPAFIFFCAMQLGVLLLDNRVVLPRKARTKLFLLGSALGCVIPVLFLLRYGDIFAFL